MAARRLIIVMLVLLGMSTLAAALAPPPQSGEDSTTTSTTTGRSEPAGGQLVDRTIDAQAERPQTVAVPLGDQLSLRVKSSRAGEVEIPDLGLLEDVTPVDPARFNILATTKGRYEVRIVGSHRVVGFLEFSKPEPGKPGEAQ